MGNIKDMLNGEPFNACIANGMVEVWLRHTERLCHFFCVMELFAVSAEIFEIKISVLSFFNIFNALLWMFSENMTLREIAAAEGASAGAVKESLDAAKKKFQKNL